MAFKQPVGSPILRQLPGVSESDMVGKHADLDGHTAGVILVDDGVHQ